METTIRGLLLKQCTRTSATFSSSEAHRPRTLLDRSSAKPPLLPSATLQNGCSPLLLQLVSCSLEALSVSRGLIFRFFIFLDPDPHGYHFLFYFVYADKHTYLLLVTLDHPITVRGNMILRHEARETPYKASSLVDSRI